MIFDGARDMDDLRPHWLGDAAVLSLLALAAGLWAGAAAALIARIW